MGIFRDENKIVEETMEKEIMETQSEQPNPGKEKIELLEDEDEDTKNAASLSDFIKDRTLLLNLVILTVIMITSQLNYFLINFRLKYIKGDLYNNQMISSTCDVVFVLATYKILPLIGLKKSFVLGYCIALIGSVSYLIFGHHVYYIPVMVLLSKVGICTIFNVVYLAFSMLFSPLYSQTAFGFAKLLGRIATICAPMVAEIQNKTPMTLFSGFCLLGAAVSFLIVVKADKQS